MPRFEFFPLRFAFVARDSLFFPAGQASNILRGAFGVTFRKLACVPACADVHTCSLRHVCAYGKIFAPESDGEGPSGLADLPRPFVFRARDLDGKTFQPERYFYFDLNLFSLEPGALACFVLSFAALAAEGLGPGRARAELVRVKRLAVGDLPERTVYDCANGMAPGMVEPVCLDLAAPASAPGRVRVDFVSPTELKHEGRIVLRPEFPVLFGRIRDRVSTLRSLYGSGPVDFDYQGSGVRAARVRMTHCELRVEKMERRSSRTGQKHSIGGFVGSAEYEGDLAEFILWLEAAQWTGVGRQAVWGKGEIRIHRAGPG